MNLLEIYVSNITSCSVCESGEVRFYKLVADKDCYGNKQIQVEFSVGEHDYQSIMQKGFYMG